MDDQDDRNVAKLVDDEVGWFNTKVMTKIITSFMTKVTRERMTK